MTPSDSFRPEELALHGESLRRLAQRLVRDGGLAEDLVQEAYAAALASPPRSPGALAAWLARVVRTRASDLRRGAERRAGRERLSARPESAPEQDAAERLAVHGELLAAVRSLREPYRTAVVLRYYEDRAPAEIARRLGVPVKTVKTRLARALEELRTALDARHDGGRRGWALMLLPVAGRPRFGPWLTFITQPGLLIMSSKAALTAVAATLALAVGLLGIWSLRERGPSSAAPRGAPPAEALASNRSEQEVAVEPEAATVPARRESADAASAPLPSAPSAVEEDGPRVLNGRVVSQSGVPVPGIRVSARSQAGGWGGGEVSGEDGRFRMEGIPAGTLIDVVLMGGFAGRMDGIEVNCTLEQVLDVDPVEKEIEFRVEFGAPEARIRGVVLSPEGDPTTAVDVTALRKQDINFMSAHELGPPHAPAPEPGEFLLARLPEGIYTVTIRPESAEWAVYRSEPMHLRAGQEWDLGVIQLQAGGTFVTRSRASEPGLEAAVEVYDLLGRRVAGVKADGRSRRLESGRYWLEVQGARTAAYRFMAAVQDGQETPVDVILQPGIAHTVECRFDPQVIRRGDWIQFEIEQAGAVVLQKMLTVERQGRAGFEACLLPGAYSVRAKVYLTFSQGGEDLAGSADFTVTHSAGEAASEIQLR